MSLVCPVTWSIGTDLSGRRRLIWSLSGDLPPGEEGRNKKPGRTTTTVTRVIRDTALSKRLKREYDFSCQVCGLRLEGPGGGYAEAAHIRPLGRPHDGPDTRENLLCLCPNHHYLFDVGAISLEEDLTLLGTAGSLAMKRGHILDPENVRYHRAANTR